MIQVSIDIAKSVQSSAELDRLQKELRNCLADAKKLDIVDLGVHTQASTDPATLMELTALITTAAGTVAAGAALLVALRKFVTSAGSLIQTVRIEIKGIMTPLEAVKEPDLDAELK
jgi:hypothetical protein